MRVKMLVTKEEHTDGIAVRMQKGSQWNVSKEHGAALIVAKEAVADPDLEYEAEETRRAAVRNLGESVGASAESIDECIADMTCTADDAFDRFAAADAPTVASPAAAATTVTTEEE
jgi:hypothetical protein